MRRLTPKRMGKSALKILISTMKTLLELAHIVTRRDADPADGVT